LSEQLIRYGSGDFLKFEVLNDAAFID
jgi:hypothetical protein